MGFALPGLRIRRPQALRGWLTADAAATSTTAPYTTRKQTENPHRTSARLVPTQRPSARTAAVAAAYTGCSRSGELLRGLFTWVLTS